MVLKKQTYSVYFLFLSLLHLKVKAIFQQRNVEKDKEKSIKFFYDYS